MARRNTTRVQIVGLDELLHDVPAFAHRVQVAGDEAATTSARHGGDAARSIVPRVSGALAGSIAVLPSAGVGEGAKATMGGGLAYGGWIEFGGSRGRPQVKRGRYFVPTQRRERGPFRDLAEHLTETEIERFPWPHPRR